MTRFDPNISVKRLVVERGSQSVFDERFHRGVNVIRGENSSGKSTILNFLFYGLGGDLATWSQYALLCDTVYVEVALNGRLATLRRTVSSARGQSMDIAGGAALDGEAVEWTRFPYQRSATKESFSQALFRLLSMPEVTDEVSSNVTMHQVLRLLYSDQLSPAESIFRFEQFDPPTLREAVGNLLCGVFQPRLYENQLRIRDLEREHIALESQLNSLFKVLGKVDNDMSLLWIEEQSADLERRRDAIVQQIVETEKLLFSGENENKTVLEEQQTAFSEVSNQQQALAALNEQRARLQLEIADSAEFIYDLERRLSALNEAQTAADFVGNIEFQWCPACFAPLEKTDPTCCHVCKAPFGDDQARDRIVNLINATATQLKQSRILQDARITRAAELSKSIALQEASWRNAAERYDAAKRAPSGRITSQLKELQRELGYVDRELKEFEQKKQMAAVVKGLVDRKAQLAGEIDELKSEVESLRALSEDRKNAAYTAISEEIKWLLEHDLRRQDSFEHPGRVWFDFSANRIGVDDQSYFSASSRAYLRTSFYAGFLSAAAKMRYFNHPRFCIIDTVEDKGMEIERSHNFQRLLLRLSADDPSEHQIIVATSMIDPELDDPAYTVGPFFTRDHPTLAIS
jgi:hypothetical protein